MPRYIAIFNPYNESITAANFHCMIVKAKTEKQALVKIVSHNNEHVIKSLGSLILIEGQGLNCHPILRKLVDNEQKMPETYAVDYANVIKEHKKEIRNFLKHNSRFLLTKGH